MKRKLLLWIAIFLTMGQTSFAYDFSKAYQGKMLYYKIIDSTNHYVMLTCPKDSLLAQVTDWYGALNGWAEDFSGWNNNNRPFGSLVLPDTVSYNGIIYTIRAIGKATFYNCPIYSVVLPNTVDSLGEYVFCKCSFLSSITFSNTLRYIGDYALYHTNLGDVVLPPSVRVLGACALRGSNITNITLNDSIQYLGGGCLADNPFTSLYIPASVSFFSNAEWGMSGSLTSIAVDPNNPYYDSRDNCNAVIDGNNLLVLGCRNTVIPNGVNYIEGRAFGGCTFETLVIPNTVLSLSLYACHTSRLVLSSPIMNIDWNSFGGIDTIQLITDNPPIITVDGYTNYAKPITVPCNAIPTYQANNIWSNFTNFIESGVNRVSAQSGGHGTVTLVKPTCANPSATFTATADEGYHFVQWNDGNTDNPRIVPIVSDTALTASFAINHYTVNAIPNDPEMGNVTGSGIRAHGSTIFLTATANSRYHFDHWSDNVTENPRTLTVTRDTSITAFFVALPLDTLYVHDTIYVDVHDTTVTYLRDTLVVNYYQYDTTIVNTYDTSIYNHFRYDTTLVYDTMIVNVYTYDTSIYNNYRYDTVILNTYQYDTTIVYDTTIINTYRYDTTLVNVYDTTINNVYIYDTTIVNNFQYDTIIVNNYVYDTVVINNYTHDTVNNYYHDTINNYYYDTVIITHHYHDTVVINNYIYDTIYLNRYIFDTIYIHDTIYVGGNAIGDVMTVDAKIYAHDGQIVVEGAEGMPVMLYDATGRLLAMRRSEDTLGGTPLRLDVPASGTYLIKVGNHPARKVVVIR